MLLVDNGQLLYRCHAVTDTLTSPQSVKDFRQQANYHWQW
jgi:hypothetical protein